MSPHRADVLSLVLGIVFVGVAAMWFLVTSGSLSVAGLSVALPVLLVSAGLAGVLASFTTGRRPRDD